MMTDRNKTEITRVVTAAAVRYLDERGCKPVETEVPIDLGWVADIAGVLNPTMTELIELKLLKRKPRYSHPDYQAWHELAKDAQKLMTVLVEVKTSRADFRGDRKWVLPIPTNLAYVAIPKDLAVGMDEMPANWGVLEYWESTDCVRCLRVPGVGAVTTEQQLSVVLQVAIRRDHDTRYERIRKFRREILTSQNENVSRTRVNTAMRAMSSIVHGKYGSLEAALEYHGIKHLAEYDMLGLRKLWAIAPEVQP